MDSEHRELVEVDGETFELLVRADAPDQHHFTWLTGPNPGYGFTGATSAGGAMSRAEKEHQVRAFLRMVDPGTGYVE